MKKTKIEKLFGSYVLSDNVLKNYLPKKTYKKYMSIKEMGEPLDSRTAKDIAKAIKNWAIKMGATHYSHWFMPLTNKTAEKQVSFIEVDKSGNLIEDFSEKSLIKGETDASSFPNGGERLTFEARGYTVWDYTSPAFIKEDTAKNRVVYIPTAFCSYNGTALDDKTPLLRATEKLSIESVRVLKHLGYSDVNKVSFFAGAEQEYFLVKTNDFNKRLDLKITGRTLFGNKPLISQEVCSHYFGMIDDCVSKFMNEVDNELWKMGITAKLQHNEVAPSQHEFVPIYSYVNTASDQNQLIMEVISRMAKRHGYTALFEEKPFAYINGSGKHINISLSTNTGLNLFDCDLKDEKVFYTFFVAMITAIDKYYKLIRLSTAYRGNDLRLGGDEAPPALISVFTSDYILDKIKLISLDEKSKKSNAILDTRVKSLPKAEKDFCDRNRTSPFAFTGNKFEFRMVGSSQSIAWPSTCICTILAKALKDIADKLDSAEDKMAKLNEILSSNLNKHSRIIFNGNGYTNEWKEEAKTRGLIEYKDSLSVYNILEDSDIIELFESTKILNKSELELRKATLVKNYLNTVMLESGTMAEMLNKQICPSLNNYIASLTASSSVASLNKNTLKNVENCINNLHKKTGELEEIVERINKGKNNDEKLNLIKNNLLILLKEIRNIYDAIEHIIPEDYEPFPTYNDILF